MFAQSVEEFVSPIGVLFIEGYDPTSDWLSSETLYQIAASMNPGQVHLFSARELHRNESLLSALVSNNRLTLHTETLAQFLSQGEDSGKIELGITPADVAFGQNVRIAGRTVAVPQNLFQQINATGRLITELAFAPLRPQSRDAKYADFRQFLYQSSDRPAWEGYAKGFAFRRAFQDGLRDIIRKSADSASRKSEPIILHGPTGSGKTVALGQLAFDLQKEGRYTVLFIDRSIRQVRNETVDSFCLWAENQKAPAVIIVCDGMLELRDYRKLDLYLRSRGRKSVLVGSCYQTDANYQNISNGVVNCGNGEGRV